jgi:hypothetical protein
MEQKKIAGTLLQLKNLSYMFCLQFPSCKSIYIYIYKEGVLPYICIVKTCVIWDEPIKIA